MSNPTSASFWLACWSFMLAWAWLMPNRYPPWVAFHADAWTAATMLVAGATVAWRNRQVMHWHGFTLVLALLATVPLLQYAVGVIPLAGLAWTSTAYLLGLVLAVLLGVRWEQAAPGQAQDGLFLAIGLAGIVSVGIQLYQWLPVHYPALDLWVLASNPHGPGANLGQRNQLGTLLLWALLACAWGLERRKISPPPALLMAAFLVLGLALTRSRTAMVGLLGISAAAWLWRRHWSDQRIPWAATVLCGWLGTCLMLIPLISGWLGLEGNATALNDGQSSTFRWHAYRMLLDASHLKPWLGFGWSNFSAAQLAVAQDHPPLPQIFSHGHNLFLDLVLWLGWPLGLATGVFLVIWFLRQLRRVAGAQDALLLLFLGVLSWHAMLELPHQYGYLLFPASLVIGVVLAQDTALPRRRGAWWAFAGMLLLAGALLLLLGRDYLRVEASLTAARFEAARTGKVVQTPPPDTLLLTQWQDYIELLRVQALPAMTPEKLHWMENVTPHYAAAATLYNLVKALALNGRLEDARLWAKKMSLCLDAAAYRTATQTWARDAELYPVMRQLIWPTPSH